MKIRYFRFLFAILAISSSTYFNDLFDFYLEINFNMQIFGIVTISFS